MQYANSWAIVSLLCLASSGCATTFTADTDFPEPLIEPLPLTVAVYYDDRFRAAAHDGMSPRGARWTALLGAANVAAFDGLFNALFERSYRVTSGEPITEPIHADALVAPEMESFRLAMPGDFDQRHYTVWIEYRLRMLAPNGDLIVDWLVTASGKSLRRGWNFREPMQQATYLAMRDATATLAVDFRKQPDIDKWLRENNVIPFHREANTAASPVRPNSYGILAMSCLAD